MSPPIDLLVEQVRATHPGLMVIVTGAGVSHASGIPTFRGSDPDAVWAHDVTELGTFAYFARDPVGSWRWYLKRFEHLEGAEPNDAHRACVALESWQLARGGDFLLITQNIDTLHRRAGSTRLVEVHGRADRVRCPEDGCPLGAPRGSLPRDQLELAAFTANPGPETLPRCPKCSSPLRQHVLWFDEYYTSHDDYAFDHVVEASARARLLLFVGTSFSVGVTDLLLRAGNARRIPMFSIDPSGVAPTRGMVAIPEPAEAVLPELVRRVTKDPGD